MEYSEMGKLVFFVDDDKMILNLLDYTFNNSGGIVVKTFNNGEKCLNSLQDNPDSIILDHNFISVDSQFSFGFEILEKIREKNKTVPVYILSSEKAEILISKYTSLNVKRFISKDEFFIDSVRESISETFPA